MAQNPLAKLSGTDPTSIDKVLRTLAARIRNSPTNDSNEDAEDTSNAVSLLRSTFDELSQGGLTDRERIRLASFEQWSDSNILPDILLQINTEIVDFASARRAVQYYDISWFASQPLSNSGKQQLAGALVRLVLTYGKNINQFWQALMDGNASALSEVSFNIAANNEGDAT